MIYLNVEVAAVYLQAKNRKKAEGASERGTRVTIQYHIYTQKSLNVTCVTNHVIRFL